MFAINDMILRVSEVKCIPEELRKYATPVAQFLFVTLAVLEALKENLLCGPARADHCAAFVEVADVPKASRRPFDKVLKADQLPLLRRWA